MFITNIPRKPLKLPERLIFEPVKGTYKMINLKTGKVDGTMVARPDFVKESGIYPKMKNFWAYYVVGLHAKVKEQGVGKSFEKFLRTLAKKDERCEGRIWLRAFNNINPSGRASSTWWAQRGYKCCDKTAQNELDRIMRGQKPKYGDWYRDMDMYLPTK